MTKQKSKLIELGEIIGFHGIKGEMKVKPYAEIPETFLDLENIIIEGKSYQIKNARIQKGFAFLILEKITDRNAAEAFRNKVIQIDRESIDDLEENEFFIVDLIGFPVFDRKSGEKIGTIKDISQTSGPVDTFIIKTKEKLVYVPALKEHFEIFLDEGKILAEIPQELFEL